VLTGYESAVPPPPTPARPGGRGAAAPSLRLEERSSSDREDARPIREPEVATPRLVSLARIRSYPGGEHEVTVTRRPCTTTRRGAGVLRVPAETREVPVIEAVAEYERNSLRAKSVVRRSIMAAGLDHMLTLTYRRNQTDALQAHADLTRFLRLMRAIYRSEGRAELQFVAVLERQKRGACHWHMAVRGRQTVRALRPAWRSIVGDGNIDATGWLGRGHSDSPARLACYLSKYVSKCINDRVAGLHRYRRSRNIVVAETVEEHDDPDLGRVTTSVFRRVAGSDPAFILRTDVGAVAFVWACSWGSDRNGAEPPSGPLAEPPSG
jgi:hypothetical protein